MSVLDLSVDELEDRFARFQLISWWDQARLSGARVLVIGAGELGNELLKNLALLGVGRVVIVDFDVVENSNLSRSALFRSEDRGKQKAEVAARSAQDIYPGLRVQPLASNVVYDVGMGLFRWADVILGGLDNREARVAINLNAARAAKTWIDGAIERLDGVARVFDPASGPCYECTMGANDWKMLEARRSCALLRREEMEQGKVPTTPTTSSVIAGIQVQEAVKLLHGMPTLAGRGFVFDGLHHQSYVVQYTRKDDCGAHEPQLPVLELPLRASQTKAGDLLEQARSDLGPGAVVEFNQDLLSGLTCPKCGTTEEVFSSLGKITEARGRCPDCREHRVPQMYHTLSGSEPFLGKSLGELGVPAWDVVGARVGLTQRFYELSGDEDEVLGPARRTSAC